VITARFFASLPFDFAPFLRQGKQGKKAHASTRSRNFQSQIQRLLG
jgi:hypothetical protein